MSWTGRPKIQEENSMGLRALRLQAKPEFRVKGLKTVAVGMTQWEVLKINWFHTFSASE